MADLQTEQKPEHSPAILAVLDVQIFEAKQFLKKCGYVTLSEQEYINLNRRVIVGVLAGVSPGILLGYALCRLMGG